MSNYTRTGLKIGGNRSYEGMKPNLIFKSLSICTEKVRRDVQQIFSCDHSTLMEISILCQIQCAK